MLAVQEPTGTVRLRRADTGVLIASLAVVGQDRERGTEWLCFTPGGFYWGSTGVGRLLRWQVAGEPKPSTALEASYLNFRAVAAAVN